MKRWSQKKRGVSLTTRKQWAGYWFVLPFVIGFVLFFLSPFLFYVVMAFSKMSLTNTGISFTFNHLENFKEVLLNDPQYLVSVFQSLQPILLNLFAIVLYSLFIAILLNQRFWGRAFVRAVFFLPVVVASGSAALSGSNDQLLTSAQILLNNGNATVEMGKDITQTIVEIFGSTGATQQLVSLVSNIVSSMFDITQAAGVQILIFLSGLQSINVSMYEASRMDGATGWENFWKITLPLISPMILVNAVYTIVDQLSSVNNETVSRMYKMVVEEIQYTSSAAMGVLYFAIVITILVLIMVILSRFVCYENRDMERGRQRR